jgi:hypothetical protein
MKLLTIAWAALAMMACPFIRGRAGAQELPSGDKTVELPRTADGQPDIHGYWINPPKLRGATGIGIDLEGRSGNSESPKYTAKQNAIVDPPDGKVPYQPWAEAVREQNWKGAFNPTAPEQIDSMSRCFELGMPRTSYFPGAGGTLTFQILQVPGYVVMVYDAPSGASRVIPLDGRPHIGKNVKLWEGDSVGHWEGNTLVVDVTNINESAWYDWGGNFHSNELHVVERYTVVGPDKIDYEETNYDPKVLTKPFTVKFGYVKKTKANEQWENSCYEYELDVDAMLKRNTADADSK